MVGLSLWQFISVIYDININTFRPHVFVSQFIVIYCWAKRSLNRLKIKVESRQSVKKENRLSSAHGRSFL